MIRIRELKGQHRRVCDGHGLRATFQIVVHTMIANEPHSNVVDCCDRCGESLEAMIDKRSRRQSLKKLGVR